MIEQMELHNSTPIWRYKVWQKAGIDLDLKQQLVHMSEADIHTCFGSHLSFGNEGMQGIMAPGTNCMNRYTVRRIAYGAVRSLLKQGRHKKRQGVVIGYDTRKFSKKFAEEAALVFAKNDIKVYLYEKGCAISELCFAITELGAAAGCMITANHLPNNYNGLKLFGNDGSLYSATQIESIANEINDIEHGFEVKVASWESALSQGLIHTVSPDMGERYVQVAGNVLQRPFWMDADAKRLKVVYTSLHGSSCTLMNRMLNKAGFNQVIVVHEQESEDGKFSTISAPDPRSKDSYELAIQTAKHERAQLILATDSSGERTGVAIRTPMGEYLKLACNQLSALLANYLLTHLNERKRLPENGVILKSAATSDLCRKIAATYGVHTINTLPGYHDISDLKRKFRRSEEYTPILSFSESDQFSIGDITLHADGVKTGLLVCEMASYYLARGETLYEQLRFLYQQYGFYKEDSITVSIFGSAHFQQIKELMSGITTSPDKTFWGGRKLLAVSDYMRGVRVELMTGNERSLAAPQTTLMKLHLEDDAWVVLHPMEQDAKFTMYLSVNASKAESCQISMKALKHDLTTYLFETLGKEF